MLSFVLYSAKNDEILSFRNLNTTIFSRGKKFDRGSLRSKRFRRVWEQRKTEEQPRNNRGTTEERGFRYFACAENGARAKKRTVGVGEGKKGTACRQTPGF